MSLTLLLLISVISNNFVSSNFAAKEKNPDLSYFRNMTEIYDYLEFIEKKFRSKFVVETFGKTFHDNDLKVLKICHHKVCGTNPIIYIQGGIHAREWLSPATVLYLISKLTTDIDSQDREIISKFDFFIVPLLNPDGYAYSRTSAYRRLWRKNRWNCTKDNEECSTDIFDCVGVDLNRNFPTKFWDRGHQNACSSEYQGLYPYSEPESSSLKNLLDPYKEKIIFFNDLHTHAQMVLLPWNYMTEEKTRSLHGTEYNELINFITAPTHAMMKVHGKSYAIGHAYTLLMYKVYGDVVSWAHDYLGIKYTYGMELRPEFKNSPLGFLIEEKEIIPTGEEVWAFHRAILIQLEAKFWNEDEISKDTWKSFHSCGENSASLQLNNLIILILHISFFFIW